jgi:maltose alpha-D-glucosyltransferase/alpha-amylase
METRDMAALPVIDLPGGWETILEGRARTVLEQEVLPWFLQQQRWFGGKARGLESVRLIDQGTLPAGNTPAFLVLLEVRFADATTDRYFLPLGVTVEPAAAALLTSQRSRVLARLLRTRGAEAVLHDALADAAACTALLEAIGAGREWSTRSGRIRAVATAAFAELRGQADTSLPMERGPETSSNSLVFFGRRLLLKLFRRLEVGINPDFEIGRFLTETSRFPRIPKVAGTIEYHRPGSDPVSLAILQEQVANQGDGWSHALDELGRYFERAARRDPLPPKPRPLLELANTAPPAAIQEVMGSYLQTAAILGRRTAELHLALAGATQDPLFTPEPLTAVDLGALIAQIQKLGRQALGALRDHAPTLPGEVGAEAHRLLTEGPRCLEHLAQIPAVPSGAVKIRCHGDYHLGQVLRVENDFVILDFEGEPTRTVAERRAKQSPLKDVAGMLRSFDYAAYAGLFAFTRDRPNEFGRLEPWAELWRQWTSAAFLRAYRTTAGRAVFLPADGAALLDLFMLDKAFYELAYELNNRPDWVRIPLRGILALLPPG